MKIVDKTVIRVYDNSKSKSMRKRGVNLMKVWENLKMHMPELSKIESLDVLLQFTAMKKIETYEHISKEAEQTLSESTLVSQCNGPR